MAFIPPVYALLSGAAAVTTLVADRIHAQGYAGDSPQAPYITWQIVTGTPGNYVSGRPGTDDVRVQVDAWAKDPATAQAIGAAVAAALELAAQGVSFFDDYDSDAALYRFGSDWRFIVPR